MTKTGLAVGLNKGHVTEANVTKPKPVNRKGVFITSDDSNWEREQSLFGI